MRRTPIGSDVFTESIPVPTEPRIDQTRLLLGIQPYAAVGDAIRGLGDILCPRSMQPSIDTAPNAEGLRQT